MKASLISCDTSVLVPALHRGLVAHEECRERLRGVSVLPAHVVLETYRVLTSARALPSLAPETVVRALEALGVPHVQLAPEAYLGLVRTMAAADRPGGAIYDAQIAATAKHHGLTLLSRDRRAAKTYELVGAEYELIR